MTRCPSCGASNPASATWCLQCFTAFGQPDRRSPARTEAAEPAPEAARPDDAGPGSDAAPPGDAGSPEGALADHRFRRTDEGVDWRCGVCEGWNPIERHTCRVCEAPFSRTFGEQEQPPDVDETTAIVATIVLPGAGHLLAGRIGSGLSRALIYLVWLLGGSALLTSASASGQGLLPALPLLLGALAVWVASLLDTRVAVAGGRPENEVLRPRVFLWVVVGVIGLLMFAFGASALTLA